MILELLKLLGFVTLICVLGVLFVVLGNRNKV